MNQLFYLALPLFLMTISIVVPISYLVWARKRRHRNRRSPLTAKLLRGPGETLRRELDAVLEKVNGYIAMLFCFPLLVLSLHLAQSHFGGMPESATRWLINGIAMVVFVGLILRKMLRLSKLRSNLQHGLEAEIAMGQELDQLMRAGAVVYHDFPAEGFNIDHILLASNGVFAVETKGRLKPDRGGGKDDAKVNFNGNILSFPGWTESKMLDQAQRQAAWLAKWISSAVGEPVAVRGVVALPGWWVDRTGRGDVLVISGREASALLKVRREGALSEQLMQRIEHQLAARCRDIEPSLYGRQEKWGRPASEAEPAK